MKNISPRTRTIVITSALSALIIVMSLTPLGYLQITPGFAITFLCIPVAIGAVMEGPAVGLILGLVFGLSSYSQAFGKDLIGTTLNGIHPIYTFLMCVLPRVLTGLLTGLSFKLLDKMPIRNTVAGGISCFICSVLNTVLFLGAFALNCVLCDYETENVLTVLLSIMTLNSLVEAVACTIIGTVCISILMRAYHRA